MALVGRFLTAKEALNWHLATGLTVELHFVIKELNLSALLKVKLGLLADNIPHGPVTLYLNTEGVPGATSGGNLAKQEVGQLYFDRGLLRTAKIDYCHNRLHCQETLTKTAYHRQVHDQRDQSSEVIDFSVDSKGLREGLTFQADGIFSDRLVSYRAGRLVSRVNFPRGTERVPVPRNSAGYFYLTADLAGLSLTHRLLPGLTIKLKPCLDGDDPSIVRMLGRCYRLTLQALGNWRDRVELVEEQDNWLVVMKEDQIKLGSITKANFNCQPTTIGPIEKIGLTYSCLAQLLDRPDVNLARYNK